MEKTGFETLTLNDSNELIEISPESLSKTEITKEGKLGSIDIEEQIVNRSLEIDQIKDAREKIQRLQEVNRTFNTEADFKEGVPELYELSQRSIEDIEHEVVHLKEQLKMKKNIFEKVLDSAYKFFKN